MKKYILCLILVFLAFIPWLPILFKQLFNVQSSRYWEYFPESFYGLIKSFICIFILSPVGKLYIADLVYYLFVVLILLIVCYCIFNNFKSRKKISCINLNFFSVAVVVSFCFILIYCYLNKTFAIRYFSVIYSLILFMVIYYLVNNYSFFCIVIFFVYLLVFYWNYAYVTFSGILNQNNYLDKLESELEQRAVNEDIYIYYPGEATLEIMLSTSLKKYNNFIVYNNSCVINVLNDYSLFGGDIVVYDYFSDVANALESFYMIEIVTEVETSLDNCTFQTLRKFNYSYLLINEYYSGYNGDLFRLYKVSLNRVE